MISDNTHRGNTNTSKTYTVDDRLIGISVQEEDLFAKVFLWISNGSGGIDTLMSGFVERDDLFLQPGDMFRTKDNDILLNFLQIQPSFPPLNPGESPPRWFLWLKIDGKKIGLTTSTNNIDVKKQTLLYPNPTKSSFSILDMTKLKKIQVIDIHGKILLTKNSNFSDIDISNLSLIHI